MTTLETLRESTKKQRMAQGKLGKAKNNQGNRKTPTKK